MYSMSKLRYSDSNEDDESFYDKPLSEEEEEVDWDYPEKKNPGLDMSHGFIHHIRQNQVDRDNFDKMKKSESIRKKAPKKKYPAERNLYVPPSERRNSMAEGRSNVSEAAFEEDYSDEERPLYKLSYTDINKKTHRLTVCKDDDPEVVAMRLMKVANIPDDLYEALVWKIKTDKQKYRWLEQRENETLTWFILVYFDYMCCCYSCSVGQTEDDWIDKLLWIIQNFGFVLFLNV